nr:YqiA/YcfP family alpha/beta fold hydrolase [uncultured Desulfobulbus sp.]
MTQTATLDTVIPLFLHGLDSSIEGTKAKWFRQNFPQMRMQNYDGPLEKRLSQLKTQVASMERLILVGSSFGGLMATCFAIEQPHQCLRLVMLAPALNFEGYKPPEVKIDVPTLLIMGRHDTVCPPALVQPKAQATFNNLEIRLEEDDHMLHDIFPRLDWPALLT